MNGADFILLINMTVSGLFAFAFLGIAVYARDNAAAPVFAFGFIFAMLYFLTELAMPSIPNPRVGYMLAFTTYYLALACLVIGLARMYARPVPWSALGVLTVASLVMIYGIYDVARSQMLGMLLYQTPYSLILLLAVWVILRVDRNGVDTLMVVLFSISALHFLFKPVIAMLAGGTGVEPRDYIDTTYAMFSQSIGAALSVAGGLLLLLSLMRELIANMLIRSETDQLSGLLNRRGFEFRAEAAIEKSKRMRQALSLVLCDIDHFKAINDTFGHGVGDRALKLIAFALQNVTRKGDLVGRIGGEEFCVFLPGASGETGMRVAQRIRAEVENTPFHTTEYQVYPLTISIGVASAPKNETNSQVLSRADRCLYMAKQRGRNCVVFDEESGRLASASIVSIASVREVARG